MADMLDPRVSLILNHSKDCRQAIRAGERPPAVPFELLNLDGIVLTFADVRGVNLTGATLRGANLTGTNFGGVNFSGANFSGANLTDAKLNDAALCAANFNDADLSGADLSRAELDDTNLANSNITIEQRRSARYADKAYPKEGTKKVVFLHEPDEEYRKRLVVELNNDGKLHIKKATFWY